MEPMIKPRRLHKNGVVGIISPAGAVSDDELNCGAKGLEGLGLKVRLGKSVLCRQRYLAGSDKERAEDLHQMFMNPEIEAIICTRGGSGAGRLTSLLDGDLIAKHPKIFIGSSDITTLLLYLNVIHHHVVIHGPMVAPNFGRAPSPKMLEVLLKLLGGERINFEEPAMTVLRPGRVEGILTGGCLTLLCMSIGTPYEVATEGRILFIEDTDEAPYKIDRMLSYLKALGKFDHVHGIIFGKMVRCQFPNGSTDRLEEVIMEILGEYRFPILFGFPSGHGEPNLPLPFGIPVRLDTEKKGLTLLESAVS